MSEGLGSQLSAILIAALTVLAAFALPDFFSDEILMVFSALWFAFAFLALKARLKGTGFKKTLKPHGKIILGEKKKKPS